MPCIGTAPRNDLNLCAGRAVEVGGLVSRVDLELLHAVGWSWHDTGRPCGHSITLVGDASGWVPGEAARVHAHAAVHVVGVVATIELEATLIHYSTRDATIWAHAGLQFNKGTDIAIKAGQRVQCNASDRVAYCGIHGLQFSASGFHFYFHRGAAHRQRNVHGGGGANSYRHIGGLGSCKTLFGDTEGVGAGWNVSKNVSSSLVRSGCSRAARCGIRQGDSRACHERA